MMKLVNRILDAVLYKIFGGNIKKQLKFLGSFYYVSFKEEAPSPLQIYCLDGKTYSCGFADRLRGMITVYAYAKANNLPFKIYHREPFRLEDYLVPNCIDWRINDDEISYNILYSNPIVMMDYTEGDRLKHLRKNRQHHFYANINAISLINRFYNKNYCYTDLYNELFKPSASVEKELEPFKDYIKSGYISVSFRFMQLMGDFEDVCGNTLPDIEKKELIEKCLGFIETLHTKHSEVKYILLTTDSETFADIAKDIPYIFVLPGKIGHIGFISNRNVEMKMIMDFYMISKAKRAYMGYTGEMYKSHFAQSAAEISGIPYESIHF